MRTRTHTMLAALAAASTAGLASADGWAQFADETSTRMPAALNDPATSISDVEEKDYAWGDVDNDGDIDLVCVRKQPFTSTGKKANVLFLNEGIADGHAIDGVFVDHTATHATASDVPGDLGFAEPINDRDVVLVDLDLDGWLDMVTAVTLTDNEAKHLSHPRIYMNLGEVAGVWQGFRYEDARVPQMHPSAGPRFCSVAAGDLTGDGYPDLYFGDYDSGPAQLFDFNNRLLINRGASEPGFFDDETSTRLTSEMAESAFGAASVIADMNGDGVNDVVKQTSLNSPTHIAITYNSGQQAGNFLLYDTIYAQAPYFVSAGDLNGDGKLDLVITDDGTDRFMMNGGGSPANWTTFTFPAASSEGFGSNSVIADLNNDGHQDVLIADVDVDISGCSRRTHIYRNLGQFPNPSFQEQGQVIPDSMLTGTHDLGVFDIDGDGWLDLVVGRCTGTQIWRNVPPTGLRFLYPDGVPAFVEPGEAYEFDVRIQQIAGSSGPEVADGTIYVSNAGGPFVPTAMTQIGKDLFRATLPAAECTQQLRYFFFAHDEEGEVFQDPPTAPGAFFTAYAATGTDIALRDDVEGDISGWTITNDAELLSGAWEAADPNGTIYQSALAAPEDDATAGSANVRAFVTENGNPGGAAATNDVDGGYTYLESPTIDLLGKDANISYAHWFFTSLGIDVLQVEVTNDGGATWTPVAAHGNTGGVWAAASFVVSDYVEPTALVKVRFIAGDQPNDSITEAGVDNFQVEEILCGTACPGDLDGSGDVGFGDVLSVLSAWGPCVGCPQDLDGSGDVGFGDLLAVLSAWGACP